MCLRTDRPPTPESKTPIALAFSTGADLPLDHRVSRRTPDTALDCDSSPGRRDPATRRGARTPARTTSRTKSARSKILGVGTLSASPSGNVDGFYEHRVRGSARALGY